MVDWYRDYDVCQPCEKGFYSFQCDSGSFSLDLGGLTTFRMVGPPIIPLFPIPMGDPKRIWVNVYILDDSLHRAIHAPPEFALRPGNQDTLIRPVSGNPPGPYVSEGRQYESRSGHYIFNIGDFSPDTLDVVFLGKYFGHALPTVRFIATRRTFYQWIMNPANG